MKNFLHMFSPGEDKAISVNVMAPLQIGNIFDQGDDCPEWEAFEKNLLQLKMDGIDAISTDIWWGAVEKEYNIFEWGYFDKIAELIAKTGLKWIPILSFHACGDGFNDTCQIPLPSWIWEKTPEDLRYKSEKGNFSEQCVSVWGTDFVLEDYERFMRSFSLWFQDKKEIIQEVIIGLGPSGELRYPSYDTHDDAFYEGSYQASSELAIKAFEDSKQEFHPWYHHSLMEHGRKVLTKAAQIFTDLPIGCKVPGIHWRIDRKAEVTAGLICDTWKDSPCKGYAPLIKMIKKIPKEVNLHFTCLEKDDSKDSFAKSQVFWILEEAKRQHVPVLGENAMGCALKNPKSWENMEEALTRGYRGLTLLRMQEVLENQKLLRKLIANTKKPGIKSRAL